MDMEKNSTDVTPPSESYGYSEYKNHAEHLEGGKDMKVLTRPTRVFTAEEERKLYRKVDMRIMPILALLYLLSFMDRGNIGNARLSGLEGDLHMVGTDYNVSFNFPISPTVL